MFFLLILAEIPAALLLFIGFRRYLKCRESGVYKYEGILLYLALHVIFALQLFSYYSSYLSHYHIEMFLFSLVGIIGIRFIYMAAVSKGDKGLSSRLLGRATLWLLFGGLIGFNNIIAYSVHEAFYVPQTYPQSAVNKNL